MYTFIRGKLHHSTPANAVIDCSGIGYNILIPPSVFSSLPKPGQETTLHTSFIVREQSQTLYGFSTVEERDLFESLLDINGIGPKSALSLIGHLPLKSFEEAIRNADISMICKVPGIGKKTAERLLIEMRDKLSIKGSKSPSAWQIKIDTDPKNQTIRDAMSALVNLGYKQAIAEKALQKTLSSAPEKTDLADLITATLKNL